MAESASQFTRDMRTNQGWSTVHVIVEPIELQKPLGNPTHTEGDVNAWIVDVGVWISNRIATAASRDAIGPHPINLAQAALVCIAIPVWPAEPSRVLRVRGLTTCD
jgi:hypothetical protein